MADNNFVEQKPQTNITDGLPQNDIKTEETTLPSTTEAQESTEKHSEFNDRITKKQAERRKGTTGELSFTEAQHLVIEDIKTEKEKEKTREAKNLIEKNKIQNEKDAKIQAALAKYQEGKQAAEELGITEFKTDPEFEALLAQKEQEQNTLLEQADQKQQQELEEKQKLEAFQEQKRVEQEEEILKQEDAKQVAADNQHQAKIKKIAERQKELQQQIQDEDDSLKKIDSDKIYANPATKRKVYGFWSILLGGISSGLTGKSNPVIDAMNKAIDDDIASQKLSFEQSLAKKKLALSVMDMDLKRLNANTNNELKKVQIDKLRQDLINSQTDIDKQRLMAKKLAASEGLSREEVFAMDRKDRAIMVAFPDGKFRATTDDQLAKKLNQETIPQAKDAIRGLNRLKEIMAMPFAEINPVLRGEAATIKQALKGSLRLELFGPGVMTDFESKMADKIIGDPTKIFSLDRIERAKFDALLQKVKQGTRDKIRASGINLPESKNEKMLKQFMSKNKKLKRPEAINALIKLNYWNANEDALGF